MKILCINFNIDINEFLMGFIEYERGIRMDELWLVLYWTGPIGVGFFLVCIGLMVYLLAKARSLEDSSKK